MAKTITTLADLQKSATTYRRELLMMPVITAEATLRHMRGIGGLMGNHTLGEPSGDAQLAPYKTTRGEDAAITVTPRTLEVFLGNVAKHFDPNDVWGTIYGSTTVQGEAMKNVPIAAQILLYVAGRLGKNLNMAIWSAKRNDSGDATKDLFNGFDTITQTEIDGTKISEAVGNLKDLEEITADNAVDQIKALYNAASDELQGRPVNIYLSRDYYKAYCEDYKTTTGAVPYNTEFKKTFLEGSDDLATFVPLTSKKGSKFIHISPRENMVYGYGSGEYPGELVAIEKYSSWKLTAECAMAFGVQFDSISPEALIVGRVGGGA